MFSNYGVGWVERSETQLGVRKILGFVPQTPLLSTRGTRAQEWLPNLQLMLILGLKTDPSLSYLTVKINKKYNIKF